MFTKQQIVARCILSFLSLLVLAYLYVLAPYMVWKETHDVWSVLFWYGVWTIGPGLIVACLWAATNL